jgi:trans-aconitate 2-methyltransferase
LPQGKFLEADIARWLAPPRTDLLFANASFQWIPDHPRVLRRLLETLSPGAVLAVQMPDNTREPSHVLQREVAASGPWADNPGIKAAPRGDLLAPEEYYDLLGPASSRIDIWHSVYNHVLASPQAIVEWFKGSALQPYLSALDGNAREQFLAAYGEKIAAAYRPRFDGKVLLRFPRLFIVAVR